MEDLNNSISNYRIAFHNSNSRLKEWTSCVNKLEAFASLIQLQYKIDLNPTLGESEFGAKCISISFPLVKDEKDFKRSGVLSYTQRYNGIVNVTVTTPAVKGEEEETLYEIGNHAPIEIKDSDFHFHLKFLIDKMTEWEEDSIRSLACI